MRGHPMAAAKELTSGSNRRPFWNVSSSLRKSTGRSTAAGFSLRPASVPRVVSRPFFMAARIPTSTPGKPAFAARAADSGHWTRPPVSWALYAGYITFIVGNALGQMCTATGIAINGGTGQPVPHAQVATSSKGAATDANGVWSIAGLTCGPLRFTVERAGYLPGAASAAGSSKDIRLTLMPESSMSGRVLDEAGDPVAGVEIQVYDSSVRQGRRVMREAATVNTKGAGEYRVESLKDD